MSNSVWGVKGEPNGKALHYTGCGLPNVYLVSGWKRERTEYGDAISIKDIHGLHRAIGQHLALTAKTLSGAEVRFLRADMKLTQEELALQLLATGQQVARWETGKTEMPGTADLLLRALYLQHLGQSVLIRKLAKRLRALEEHLQARQEFKPTRDGWKALAVA